MLPSGRKKGNRHHGYESRAPYYRCRLFVIATARSTAQAKAIYETVDEKLSKGEGLEPLRVDGTREGRWIVMDYGGVIVHIFNDDTRVLYCLDKLWSDGNNVVKYESK